MGTCQEKAWLDHVSNLESDSDDDYLSIHEDDEANTYHSIHLINEESIFNVAGMEKFVEDVKLDKYGLSYCVVSIIGPQSSGKSTLLNHLFGTSFREMDALQGRFQTTKGVWLAKCPVLEPCTLVLDMEGTDGKEREDDTTFERRNALFALAVSNVVIINMWCHNVGLVNAANKPLLKTVFQVMTQLFCPRKTTLMFVLRDKTKTPIQLIDTDLRKDINQMWDSFPKPEALKETPLTEFFNIEVVALPSFEQNEEEFKKQVVSFRQQFVNSIEPGGIAGDRRDVVPSSGLSISAQQIWKTIMENKDLNLPAHKVMVATVRCEDIVDKKLATFNADEDWCQIDKTANSHAVSGFGKKLSSIIQAYLSEYDDETAYFDDGIRTKKRKLLEANMLELVQPAYRSMLEHKGSQILNIFKEEFDKALMGGEVFSVVARDCTESFMIRFDRECEDAIIEKVNWDSSKESIRLRRDLDAHVAAVCDSKLHELSTQYEGKIIVAISGGVEDLLYEADDNTWPRIRNLLLHETESAIFAYSKEISCFNVDRQTKLEMIQKLKDYGIWVVQQKAREKAGGVLLRMKERFGKLFTYDIDSRPWVWSASEDIPEITKVARSASLKLLSVMAAIRLDGEADNIENTLYSALMANNNSTASPGLLASTTWQEILLSKTLITPVKCRSLWEQFNEGIEHIIHQAEEARSQARKNRWLKVLEVTVGAVGVVASISNVGVYTSCSFLLSKLIRRGG